MCQECVCVSLRPGWCQEPDVTLPLAAVFLPSAPCKVLSKMLRRPHYSRVFQRGHTAPLFSAATQRMRQRCAVVMLQAGKGSATLSMAYAAAAFADSCLKAMAGQPGIEECAYVQVAL
jgi:lactate/malate dehydrogenase, alpha/beta C-terminal domain